jgi:hypothetical protein
MIDEQKKVLVPVEGLTVKLGEDRFKKHVSIVCFTAPSCQVKVSESNLKTFTLRVFHCPPARRPESMVPMKYADAKSCTVPKFKPLMPDPVPVEAEVIYRITGE